MNKERTKNDVGIDHGCNSEAPRPYFFSSSFSFFSLISLNPFQYMKAEPLPSAPSRLFIGNEGTWLISNSPKRAVAST